MEYIIKMPDYWKRIDLSKEKVFNSWIAASSAFDNNRSFIFGGINEDDIFNSDLFYFNYEKNKFVLIKKLDIHPRAGAKMFLKENRLYIVGGFYHNYKLQDYKSFNEIIVYDIEKGFIEIIELPHFKGIVQSAVCMDKENGFIYIYGGFKLSGNGNENDFCNNFIRVNLNNKEIEEIRPDNYFLLDKRAMMISEVLPDGRVFIFSGFTHRNNLPFCYNDYLIYDPKNNTLIKKECNEVLGRTASRSFLLSSHNYVVFYGGTYNGMETSGHFGFYDYKNDYFNIFFIFPLPGQRCEPSLFYSEKFKKVYIVGDGNPKSEINYEVYKEIMILDLNKVEKLQKELKIGEV